MYTTVFVSIQYFKFLTKLNNIHIRKVFKVNFSFFFRKNFFLKFFYPVQNSCIEKKKLPSIDQKIYATTIIRYNDGKQLNISFSNFDVSYQLLQLKNSKTFFFFFVKCNLAILLLQQQIQANTFFLIQQTPCSNL